MHCNQCRGSLGLLPQKETQKKRLLNQNKAQSEQEGGVGCCSKWCRQTPAPELWPRPSSMHRRAPPHVSGEAFAGWMPPSLHKRAAWDPCPQPAMTLHAWDRHCTMIRCDYAMIAHDISWLRRHGATMCCDDTICNAMKDDTNHSCWFISGSEDTNKLYNQTSKQYYEISGSIAIDRLEVWDVLA